MGQDWDDLSAVSKSHRGSLQEMVTASGKPKFSRPAPAFDLSLASNQSMYRWHLEWLREVHRVLRPGGTVKAFGGTRTFHRLGQAVEEAGFVDVHFEAWNYATGFPKSHSVGKDIDKRVGAERVVLGERHGKGIASGSRHFVGGKSPATTFVTRPATDDAASWEDWGTALKPAWEPVVVGAKPRRRTP